MEIVENPFLRLFIIRNQSFDFSLFLFLSRQESTPKSQIVEIDVRNNLKGDDARFEWMENGQKKSITVPANDRGVAKVTYSFRPIEFQAYTVPTGDGQQQEKRLAINGQEKFVLQSQNVGKNRVFVHLDEGSYFDFQLWTFLFFPA